MKLYGTNTSDVIEGLNKKIPEVQRSLPQGVNLVPYYNQSLLVDNAVNTVRKFGVRKPKVALITAVEKVNYQAMPCTVDAAIIAKMAECIAL